MKTHLSDKTVLFIGTSYMLEQCLLISLKIFKKIYLISNDKTLIKKNVLNILNMEYLN